MRGSAWNFAFSQACWFACVLGGAKGLLWLGPTLTILFALQVVALAPRPRRELIFLTLAAMLGSAGDRIVVALGAFSFIPDFWAPWGYPLWMTSLWVAFAGMFGYGLKWLRGRYLLAGLLGAFGGPLAYSAGASLGAIEFSVPLWQAKLTVRSLLDSGFSDLTFC